MRRNGANRKSFIAALTLCLVSAIALTAGVVYNKRDNSKSPEVADLDETTIEGKAAKENDTSVGLNEFAYNTEETVSISGNYIERDTYEADLEDEVARANAGAMYEGDRVADEVTDALDTVLDSQANEQETVVEEVAAQALDLSFNEASTLSWPIDGEVMLEYSMDKTIYFPTLDVYKCNPAMMIQGDDMAPIYSAAMGVVTDIKNDREFGNVVTVDLGNGYEATYGQLGEINCSTGDLLEKGQQIGTLTAPTAYYEVEGYNLYFKLTKDGNPVDPLEYLTE